MADTIQLTPEQRMAIGEIERNLQIIACAGSGKTEVITRRIANIIQSKPDIKPANIVAFTFTEKAAASMKARIIKALGKDSLDAIDSMYIGTIHGFCYHLLNKYTEQFRDYKVLDTVKNHLFVTRYCDKCGMSSLSLEPQPRNVKLFLECIDKMIDDYKNADSWTDVQRGVLDSYINCLYEHNYIDFSLMIFETLRQIEENPQVKEYLSQIKYLVVDEYQDVNDLQEKLILQIAEAGANICVVGDDDQTIYQFRGSNADNMISFSERYNDVHQVRLEKNYRCAPGIVDIAECVVKNNKKRITKEMTSEDSDIQTDISATRYADSDEEYAAIAERIKQLHKGGLPLNEIAILVRKGKVIVPMSNALSHAGIPFKTDSAESFFTGNYFNRFVNTLQNLVEIDKAKLYECWQDIVDDSLFNAGFKYLRSCTRNGRQSLSEIIRGFCEKTGFLDENSDDYDTRREDMDGFSKILDDYDEIYGDYQISGRINGVLKFLGTQAAEEYRYHSFKADDPTQDAVHIMTVHKAKGLEFNTVFLPELMQMEFPVAQMGGKKYWHVLGGVFEENKDRYKSNLEDERKLFYVAVTRAKQNLYMTYELSKQPVSIFVRESAESEYLQIDKDDLTYNQKVGSADSPEDRDNYWADVKYARQQLYDYFGTARHFFPAANADLVRISSMSPDEILDIAMSNGLI